MKQICIYAEQYLAAAEGYTAELVKAARGLQKEECRLWLLICGRPEEKKQLAEQLSFRDTGILYAETSLNIFQDDGLSRVIVRALGSLRPDVVLIPATRTARAVFSRAAVRMNAGMTADCAELAVENGRFIQRKSAYGANTMCVCEEEGSPKFVTVLTGLYEPEECVPQEASGRPELICPADAGESSALQITGMEDSTEESITGADFILSLGRGALEGDNLELAQAYAEKAGCMIACTRPLADEGILPFERQIGQTGYTVHPDICLYMGVSGAIQHTDGVRDARLTIAVNKDPDAAIFGCVDYGAAADMHEVLAALLEDA